MLNRIIMSGVNGASCLVKIDCTSFRLHSPGLERLIEAILGSESNGSVTTLKLSSNDVGDEGCKIIRRFLNRNSSVKSLELEDNGITGMTLGFGVFRGLRAIRPLSWLEDNVIEDITLRYHKTRP
jgi:hypothetical protein